MKTTFKASSDIALIKYWGKKDEVLRLPENGSVSIILEGLDTITTVDFDAKYHQDQVIIENNQTHEEAERVIKHLDRIRKLAGSQQKAKVVSENTFPRGTGLSSSGSGFAALTYAATAALGLSLSEKEMSILSRQGSGTACRCACGGFVEWKDGSTSAGSYSTTIFPAEHWDIRDVVAVVDEGKKKISSSAGHQSAQSSKFFAVRQQAISQKISQVKELLKSKNFSVLGQLIEAECLEFHSILLTSQPPLVMWYPGTLEVINAVEVMRKDGVEAYFTINTGFNVHVLTLPEYQAEVEKRLNQLSLVRKTLTAKVGQKPTQLSQHLF